MKFARLPTSSVPDRHRARPQMSFMMVAALAAALGLAVASGPADADDGFQSCVVGLKARAREDGISARTIDGVLAQVNHLPRIIELDRSQPEFTTTFADYFNRRVTNERVRRGRALVREHRDLLERIQRDTGVPPHYLVSFWGLETNFGSYFGTVPTPDALATLACDERRSAYFTTELMAALQIIDAGDITADQMKGSWAGALGHVQFMPSVFLRYAVDGDGDGRRDLWNSIPDAMASAGNFLEQLGWQSGQRWGREVRLPEDFDYNLIGRQQKHSLSHWRSLGVTDAFGETLPDVDLPASLLVPAGHRGPAFLVYENFNIIMRWNRSEYYALTVGRLADQIAGAGRLQQPPPDDAPRFSRDQLMEIQSHLNELGYDAGEADGILGPATRAAVSRFQQTVGMIPDGHLDQAVVDALDEAVSG